MCYKPSYAALECTSYIINGFPNTSLVAVLCSVMLVSTNLICMVQASLSLKQSEDTFFVMHEYCKYHNGFPNTSLVAVLCSVMLVSTNLICMVQASLSLKQSEDTFFVMHEYCKYHWCPPCSLRHFCSFHKCDLWCSESSLWSPESKNCVYYTAKRATFTLLRGGRPLSLKYHSSLRATLA